MNIHYIHMPTDYADELLRNGEAEKFHAFLGYAYDLQKSALEGTDPHSIRYYAKRWGQWHRRKSVKPKSNSLVVKWVNEFEEEIEKHYASLSLINARNATRVKNSAKKPKERSKNAQRTLKEPTNTDIKASQKNERTQKERQKNKEYNINDDDKRLRREFENLFFVYRTFNGSYTGNKQDALNAYREISDSITYEEMQTSIKLYMMDDKVIKKVGMKKFFQNNVYLDYMTKRVSVLISGEWIDGSYLNERFISSVTGEEMIMSSEGFAKFYAEGKVKLLDLDERVS